MGIVADTTWMRTNISESWSESALGQLGGDGLGAALQVVKRQAYSIYAEEVALPWHSEVRRRGPGRACTGMH